MSRIGLVADTHGLLRLEVPAFLLDHHGIPYQDLCFMKQKEQVGADIYVDDYEATMKDSDRNGPKGANDAAQ